MLTKLERAHLIIFSEAVSPCRAYLAVCTNFGDLMVLRLRDVLRHRVAPNDHQRIVQTRLRPYAPHGAFCLRTWQQFLIVGSEKCVEAWSWGDLIAGKASKPVWSLALPRSDDPEHAVDAPEVNSICVMEENGQAKLFAGCGDNQIHVFDISSAGEHVRALRGHMDFVHSLAAAGGRREKFHVASGSEDGTVRLWDLRQAKATAMLEPSGVQELARPHVGKWITTVAADPQSEDWLVCGGGPHLANWHLTALRPTAIFEYEARTFAQHATYHDDRLLSVGSDHAIHHWHLNGHRFAVVSGSSGHGMHVVNVAMPTAARPTRPNPRPVAEEGEEEEVEAQEAAETSMVCEYFVVVGNSNRVDVCSRLGYVVLSMEV